MTITQIDIHPITFKLKNPYAIAYEFYDTAANVLVRIETASGLAGWGNAAPDAHVTGESIERTEEILATSIVPALIGRDTRNIAEIETFLQTTAPNTPAARAAIDVALYDLLGQRARLPLYQLLGGARQRILTSVTVGIASVEDGARRARELVQAGFRALKIKTGKDWKEDVERVKAIRDAIGAMMALRVDANQGYSVQEALKFIRGVKDCQIEFIEQPTPANALGDLKILRDESAIPIMADESARAANDVLNLAFNKIVDMVNVKLMKSGGILSAGEAVAVAAAGGLPVMFGCMDESRVSIAAALHLGCALPGVHYADLDGAFDIVDDVAAGGLEFKDGFLIPSDKPGLGIEVQI
ncbi:dipeptide epimerase [candidate division KSB1 bacterium]|nr:dipeptide epimerase [candidate division KSB1 bacterium]